MAGEKEDRSIDPNIGDRVFFAREKEGNQVFLGPNLREGEWDKWMMDFEIRGGNDRSEVVNAVYGQPFVIQAANITRRTSSLGYNLKFVRGTISTSRTAIDIKVH